MFFRGRQVTIACSTTDRSSVGSALGWFCDSGARLGTVLVSNSSTVLQRQGMGSVVGLTTAGSQRAVSDVLTLRKPQLRADKGCPLVHETDFGMLLRRIDHGGQ